MKEDVTMFDTIITTLDELGVPYEEDYEAGSLTIDISSIDKETLVSVIVALNDAGEIFDITEDAITVQGTSELVAAEEPAAEEPDYMAEALGQMGGETVA